MSEGSYTCNKKQSKGWRNKAIEQSAMVQGVEIVDGAIVDRNPSTGQVIARVPVSTRQDVLDAVERSVAASDAWAATPLDERIALLRQGCAVLGRSG